MWKLLTLLCVFATLLILAFIAAPTSHESHAEAAPSELPTARASIDHGSRPVPLAIPDDEERFIKVVNSYPGQYEQAPNEFKKSALRRTRAENIEIALSDRNVNDWVGTVDSMSTTGDGRGAVSLKLPNSKISVQTWNNSLSDSQDRTLISQSSSVYQSISNMKTGDQVRFSGRFLESAMDFIKETSMTEAGSMESPEFLFVFSNIHLDRGPTDTHASPESATATPAPPAGPRSACVQEYVKSSLFKAFPLPAGADETFCSCVEQRIKFGQATNDAVISCLDWVARSQISANKITDASAAAPQPTPIKIFQPEDDGCTDPVVTYRPPLADDGRGPAARIIANVYLDKAGQLAVESFGKHESRDLLVQPDMNWLVAYENAIMKNAAQWKITPATCHGQPVERSFSMPFEFHWNK